MSDGTNPAIDLSNGTSSNSDLDGDGLPDIRYDATRSSLNSIFIELSSKLTVNDDLFVFTIDHGGRTSMGLSYLCLWNGETLYPTELANYLNQIPSRMQNIVMGQCYSGGFIGALNAENRVIATACKEDELSYARKDLTRDEFVYHWTEAATSYTEYETASGNDGYISALESFNYANFNDSQPETPQYSSLREEIGQNLSLAGKIYRIDGPSAICLYKSCNR